MAFLRRMLSSRIDPVTHLSVSPAARDITKENQIKAVLSDLAQATVTVERRSWQIRQELAGNVLSIVSGDK